MNYVTSFLNAGNNINIIILILCGLLFLIGLSKIKNTKLWQRLNPNDLHVRKPFLTDRERAFHKKLLSMTSPDTQVMCQVRLVDVIQINPKHRGNKKRYLSLFRRISQWHCDFVLLDENYNVKCVIELDDKSHNRPDRVRRDNYFRMALQQAGIELLRFDNIKNLTSESLHN
ncbi:TPA: DUF2726 domain-containing protein [Yersinia enterocolitica]|nr:DUF2726 domain-containing protein [Yersinia enterocolitica]